MRLHRSDPNQPKGWMDGPWISALPIAIGFATAALDEPHEQATTTS